MRGPETRLRLKIKKKLEELWPNSYIRKIHGGAFMNIGVSDYLGCFEGLFGALEVKVHPNKATPAQLLEGKKVIKAGGFFAVVYSVDDAVTAVREALKRKKR